MSSHRSSRAAVFMPAKLKIHDRALQSHSLCPGGHSLRLLPSTVRVRL